MTKTNVNIHSIDAVCILKYWNFHWHQTLNPVQISHCVFGCEVADVSLFMSSVDPPLQQWPSPDKACACALFICSELLVLHNLCCGDMWQRDWGRVRHEDWPKEDKRTFVPCPAHCCVNKPNLCLVTNDFESHAPLYFGVALKISRVSHIKTPALSLESSQRGQSHDVMPMTPLGVSGV